MARLKTERSEPVYHRFKTYLAHSSATGDNTNVDSSGSMAQQNPGSLAGRGSGCHYVVNQQDRHPGNGVPRRDVKSVTNVSKSSGCREHPLLFRPAFALQGFIGISKFTRISETPGEDVGSVKTTFDSPPPMGWDWNN